MSKRIFEYDLPEWPESPNVDSANDLDIWGEQLQKSLIYELNTVGEIVAAMNKFIKDGKDVDDVHFRRCLLGAQYDTLRAKHENILVALLDVTRVYL